MSIGLVFLLVFHLSLIPTQTGSVLIELNSASIAELDELPGVGPVIAGRIVEFRVKRGGFRRVEELLAIQGISERIWQGLRLKVKIGVLAGGTDSEPVDDAASDVPDGLTQGETWQ